MTAVFTILGKEQAGFKRGPCVVTAERIFAMGNTQEKCNESKKNLSILKKSQYPFFLSIVKK